VNLCKKYSVVVGERRSVTSTLAVLDVCVLQILRLRIIAVDVVPRFTSSIENRIRGLRNKDAKDVSHFSSKKK